MKKDLKLKDVAGILQVSEKTIYRWIKDEKIPYYRINHQYRFIYEDIINWMNENRGGNKQTQRIDEKKIDTANRENSRQDMPCLNLAHCTLKGGIYYRVEGETVPDILLSAVKLINIPENIPREKVLAKLLMRENMASTSIGDGIAFPHPRAPILNQTAGEIVSICFPEKPVDSANSIDAKPIHTFIVILSATNEQHLKIMSKLAFLCRQNHFSELLKKQAARSAIYQFLENCKI